jgi:AraC-like DNA-binding protein
VRLPRSITSVAYRELHQQAPLIACLWERDSAEKPRAVPVLPDACADIVSVDGGLMIAGPATGPATSAIPPGATVFGVRFRVGAAGAALGVPARELLDARVPLEDVWGREAAELAERVATAAPATRLTALANELRARAGDERPDPLARAVAGSPGTPVHRLAATLGITDRQLRRRFAAAVGYGPKTLQRVLRFQRFLLLAQRAVQADLARLAFDAGYADQAHLTREARRLAGRTPAELIADGAGPAGDRSVPFKTPAPHAATMAA